MKRTLPAASLCSLIVLLTASAGYGQNIITIDATAQLRPISPYIYGINWVHAGEPLYEDWNLGSRRLGGNRLSTYNWENNGSNSGADCETACRNQNDDWLVYRFPPTESPIPGILPLSFHQDSRDMRAYSIVQLQAAGYVAADLNDAQRPVPPAPSSRWKEVKFTKGSPFVLEPDPNDGYVYMDEQVNMLTATLGTASAGGINAYSIDNEPGLWISTHPRLRGLNYNGGADVSNADDNNTDPAVKAAKATCVEVATKGIELAKAVKAVDPTAEIFGPEFWGFMDYYSLHNAVDWPMFSGIYDNYVDMYLSKMADADVLEGTRLLDVLSLHWYPQVTETPQDILQAPRSLWDPTYMENSWITNDVLGEPIRLIPRMFTAIERNYPGTKLAITEFRFGDANNGNTWYSGLAVADALGIFGREGVYAAQYHPVDLDDTVEGYVASAYKLYRNVDGTGLRFGPDALPVVENVDELSVYASMQVGDAVNWVHIILINTGMNDAIDGEFRITNASRTYDFMWGYMFDRESPNLRPIEPPDDLLRDEFTYTIPAATAMHIVLRESIINGVADDGGSGSGAYFTVHPNPVGETATVYVRLGKGGEGKLEVFDQTGRVVATPTKRRFSSGEQTFSIDTGGLLPGAYYYRLECSGEVMVRSLMKW